MVIIRLTKPMHLLREIKERELKERKLKESKLKESTLTIVYCYVLVLAYILLMGQVDIMNLQIGTL